MERAEEEEAHAPAESGEPDFDGAPGEAAVEPGDWASEALETDAAGLAANLGTEVENAFDRDLAAPVSPAQPPDGLSANAWTGVGGGGPDLGEAPELEAYVAETLSLREHLERQAGVMLVDPIERMIGSALIDGIDEAGYFVGSCGGDRRSGLERPPRPSNPCSSECRRSSRPACSLEASPNV